MVVRRRGDPVATQLRIGDEGGRCMTGAVDLWHDLDEVFGGIVDDAGVVGCGVVPAVAALDVARAADLGEPRPIGHRQPPTLVVGEMEVEDVDLVQRDQVDVAEHVIDAEEVTGDIEHRPAVLEARPVVDLGSGDCPRAGAHGPSPRRRPGASGAASSALGTGRPALPRRCALRRSRRATCSSRRSEHRMARR